MNFLKQVTGVHYLPVSRRIASTLRKFISNPTIHGLVQLNGLTLSAKTHGSWA
jgi:hypothetical protein